MTAPEVRIASLDDVAALLAMMVEFIDSKPSRGHPRLAKRRCAG